MNGAPSCGLGGLGGLLHVGVHGRDGALGGRACGARGGGHCNVNRPFQAPVGTAFADRGQLFGGVAMHQQRGVDHVQREQDRESSHEEDKDMEPGVVAGGDGLDRSRFHTACDAGSGSGVLKIL
jgi:hypothetical protein